MLSGMGVGSSQDLPGNLLVPLHGSLVLDNEYEVEAGQDRALQVNVLLRSFQVIIPANETACSHQCKEAGVGLLLVWKGWGKGGLGLWHTCQREGWLPQGRMSWT